MTIRTAQQSDFSTIVDIYNQAVEQGGLTADLTPISLESRQQWFQEHTTSDYPIWVFEQSGVVIGWCSLSPYRCGRKALRHTAEISYYIDTAYQNRGIGSQLMQYAIENAPARKFHNLFALLLASNPLSIRLLTKFGFEQWGRLPEVAEIEGECIDHLIYGRKVG
ncbi:MAG: GNAT family N-acetyltransferase [Chromatiales bacterium]|nr:GNAT family N-acetyltransferase [Chromatiales bacterium]